MAERTEGLELSLEQGEWAVYQRGGPKHNGPWEFCEVIRAPDDPESAARSCCVNHWAGGAHRFLVVGPEVFEFEVSVETKEVVQDA